MYLNEPFDTPVSRNYSKLLFSRIVIICKVIFPTSIPKKLFQNKQTFLNTYSELTVKIKLNNMKEDFINTTYYFLLKTNCDLLPKYGSISELKA